MSLADSLPRLAGLPTARVEGISSGAPYSAAEYEALCRALAVDPAALYRGEETRPNRLPARFRSALGASRPDGQDLRLLALAVEQGRILAHLLAGLGRTVALARHRTLRPARDCRDVWREGYELGENARAELLPRPGPILDLEELLGALGAHVAHVTLSSAEIDAACVWEPDAVPVVLLNDASRRHQHPGALRATLAHELCHLLHDAGERDLTTQVSWGAEGSGNYSETLEVRARAFAPAFLAPRPQVRDWLSAQPALQRGEPSELVRALGEHWGLSFEGAIWHAKNCGVLDAQDASSLAAMPRTPWLDLDAFARHVEASPTETRHPALLTEPAAPWRGTAAAIVLSALDEGLITAGRAEELLSWG